MIALAAVVAIGLFAAYSPAFAACESCNNGYGNGYDGTTSGSYNGDGTSQGNSGNGESRYGTQRNLKANYTSCYCR